MDKRKTSEAAPQWTKTRTGPSEFSGKIEAFGTKRILLTKTQAQFQGRRFRLEVGKDGNFDPGPGPFRVSYRLYNPFAIFDDALDTWSEVREKTNIRVPKDVAEKKFNSFYEREGEVAKNFDLSLKVSDEGWLQEVVIVVDETIDKILGACDQIVAAFLDYVSFIKQTPIEIRGVQISRVDTGQPVGVVVITPYSKVIEIDETELMNVLNSRVPASLVPIFRAFREAINSTNPAYQLLCLWGIYEALKNKVRSENRKKVGRDPKRPRRRIPDNELTRSRFARWIGRSYEEFLDFVQNGFRDNVAHLLRKDGRIGARDPALMQHAIDTDLINCMQISMLQQLILDEWNFMKENNLT